MGIFFPIHLLIYDDICRSSVGKLFVLLVRPRAQYLSESYGITLSCRFCNVAHIISCGLGNFYSEETLKFHCHFLVKDFAI